MTLISNDHGQSATARRNRAIKRTLEAAFGKSGMVRVRGARGTAYGWVDVHIDITPLDNEAARELTAKVWELLDKADLSKQIGTYGYDDPGSDYGFGREIHISFNPSTYAEVMRHSDGTRSARRHWSDVWETMEEGDACPS